MSPSRPPPQRCAQRFARHATPLLAAAASLLAAAAAADDGIGEACAEALAAGMPPHYVAYRVEDSEVTIDGRLDDAVWRDAPKVDDFVSIYGPQFQQQHPEERPWHGTTGQILWSDKYVYVGGRLEESQLWALDHGWTLPTQQVAKDRPRFECNEAWIPSCPYRSADFEFFFSPGPHGNTEWYKEFEFNANVDRRWNHGEGPSVMTLALPRPYNDLHGDIPLWLNPKVCAELRDCSYKVTADGPINDPSWATSHPNGSWTVEVKIPIEYLIKNATGAAWPADGVQWRQAFSRVEYRLKPNASAPGGYEKVFATAEERAQGHLDRNFVWPPTYMYDIHMPDLWAILQFSSRRPEEGGARFDAEKVNWPAYGTLSRLYYAQWDRRAVSGSYSADLAELREAYEVLSDPRRTDAYKRERQIFQFPAVPAAAWSAQCAGIRVELDAETGWTASVRTPGRPGEVWSMDGWRRVRVTRSARNAALVV